MRQVTCAWLAAGVWAFCALACGGDNRLCNGRADCENKGITNTGGGRPNTTLTGTFESLTTCNEPAGVLRLEPNGQIWHGHRQSAGPTAPTVANGVLRPGQPFLVYWSICNAGRTPTPAAPDNTLEVRDTTAGQLRAFAFSLPTLVPCACHVSVVEFPMGLPQGIYDVRLTGAVSANEKLITVRSPS